MINRNECFSNLTAGYLFPEVARRRREYAVKNPSADIISLGIGNTTEPLPKFIAKAMADYALSLATAEGYSGYGDDYGNEKLREKIAHTFYNNIEANEVFVSDGAKCDIARLQTLFGRNVHIAVQDPSYPVYVDGSVIIGAAGKNNGDSYENITYMPCTPENNFFPDLKVVPKNSLIYFCSPNNPTGVASTKAELKKLVDFANENGCIIIFDAAYSEFIRDASLPKSIFEIDGAKTCAIEVQSFSKPAGFTGVRLGWSVVPEDLKFSDGTSVNKDWKRVHTTLFNCASNISQMGGLACLEKEGLSAMKSVIDYYLENVKMIGDALRSENFKKNGIEVFSTGNSPYLWVRFPNLKSWDAFDLLLEKCNIVTTPGVGFGPSGENFLRFSAFAHKKDVEKACERLRKLGNL